MSSVIEPRERPSLRAPLAAPDDVEGMLRVQGLRVETISGQAIVEDLSLTLADGEILAIVGESGSGKTTAALALLGYARRGARIVQGSVTIGGEELIGRSSDETRRLRGRLVSYVPQDPASALNPSMRIGTQVEAVLKAHAVDDRSETRLAELMRQVRLPEDPAFLRRFPHQLSGGQQQRVAIAMALSCSPRLIVLDEPTSAIDVISQRLILEEIRRLRTELGIGMVFVSHNLAVVASIADHIAVFYAGRVVENGLARDVLERPRHPYARALLAAVPDHLEPRQLSGIPGAPVSVGEHGTGCDYAPRCPLVVGRCLELRPALAEVSPQHEAACHELERSGASLTLLPVRASLPDAPSTPVLDVVKLVASYKSRGGRFVACQEVSFSVTTGASVAVVGESGSGKTTIARCIAGLHRRDAGQVLFDANPLAPLASERTPDQRRRIQMVFQNPYASLNPTHTVGDSVARAAQVLLRVSAAEGRERAVVMLNRVRLPAQVIDRFPAELSGGERQRVAIARALVAEPELLICDEITSALDVSVQAAVIELLDSLRAEFNLSLLFISHDLAVVATVADIAVVLERGQVREHGPVQSVLTSPSDEYTRALVAAAPRLDDEHRVHGARGAVSPTIAEPRRH